MYNINRINNKKMVVLVAISGSSGCGKSTLVDYLTIKYPYIIVKDTDTFLVFEEFKEIISNYKNILDANNNNNNSSDEDAIQRHDAARDAAMMQWRKMYGGRIDAFIKEHENDPVVMVGLTSHGSPDPSSGFYPIPAQHHLFMDVPFEQLLIQYYNRHVLSMIYVPDTIPKIISGEVIIPDSQDYINWCNKDKTLHLKQGYIPVQREELYKWLDIHLSQLAPTVVVGDAVSDAVSTFSGISDDMEASKMDVS
jgi:energy-coupling factor transporter ATP-binding protein EcfA2